MDLVLLIWYFFSYAVFGYIVEVLYCSLGQRRFVNRGFLHGPYLPIYGFGALLVIFFGEIAHNPVFLFLLAFFGTSALEYFTGYLAEHLFNIRLWDYSTYPFNFKGRICLLNSSLFGLLSLVVNYIIHPFLSSLIYSLDKSILGPGSMIIVLLLSVDSTSSIFRMSAFQKQLSEFRVKKGEIENRLKILRNFKENKMLEGLRVRLDVELDDLRLHMTTSAKRILNAFPSLTSSNEEKRLLLENLRKSIKENSLHKRFHDSRNRSKKRDD